MEKKQCRYFVSKRISEDTTFTAEACLSSIDNQEYDFSVVCELYETFKNGKAKKNGFYSGGQLPEELAKYCPELVPVQNMHLRNINGLDLYQIANGMHFLRRKEYGAFARYFDTTIEEAKEYRKYFEFGCDDLQQYYIESLIYKNKFIEKRRKLAKDTIKLLEEFSGEKFENDRECRKLNDRKKMVLAFVASQPEGYYSKSEINKRNGQYFKHIKHIDYLIALNKIAKERQETQRKLEIFKYLHLISGIHGTNLSLYMFDNVMHINFSDIDFCYGVLDDKKINTIEKYNEFVSNFDTEAFPYKIEFNFKGKTSYQQNETKRDSDKRFLKWYDKEIKSYEEDLQLNDKKRKIAEYIYKNFNISLSNINIFDNFISIDGSKEFTNFECAPIINTIEQIRKLHKHNTKFNAFCKNYNVKFEPNRYDDSQRCVEVGGKDFRDFMLLSIDEVLKLKKEEGDSYYIVKR